MNKVNLKQVKKQYNITLHKVNRELLSEIPNDYLISLNRSIDSIDELVIEIPNISIDKSDYRLNENYIYNNLKKERLICIDDSEYFVIKDIEITINGNYEVKKITAYSLEVKLSKIDISIEDTGIYLDKEDLDLGIINLNEYMYDETGWRFAYIEDIVRYDIDEDGVKTDKLRWQESVNLSWYDFITKNIQEEYGCVAIFDTYKKEISLYDIDSFGDNLQIVLGFDNYIKNLVKEESTNDIITRLKLVGCEELDIISHNPTGYDYIENYSYFINNGEMSHELIDAMHKYNQIVEFRSSIWSNLVEFKNKKNKELLKVKSELFEIYETISAYKSMKDRYAALNDIENEVIMSSKITKLNDRRTILEVELEDLEYFIEDTDLKIHEINILCRKETATDEDGNLIFNDTLLNELKEFIYYDTYSNDSFIQAKDLIEAGKRELKFRSIPTYSYSIDLVNFLKRAYMHPNRKEWNGELGLGDIVSIYNKETQEESFLYFVGYIQNFKDGALSIDLSNKKMKNNNIKNIADLLGSAKRSLETIVNKRYLWNKQKYNRINLNQEVL